MSKKLILLVEDSVLISFTNKSIVEKFDYEVITAQSGEEAIEIVRSNKNIDLILMDIDLGEGIDGIETSKEILKLRNYPIVFLTGRSDEDYVRRMKEVSRYGIVSKNTSEDFLESSIAMAFELFGANSKLLAHEKRTLALINHLEVGIIVHAADTSIIESNDKASVHLGLTHDQLMGRTAIDPYWRFVDKNSNVIPHENYPVNIVIRTGLPIKNEIVGVIKDEIGKVKWFRVNGVPIKEGAEITEIIISFIEIALTTKN